MKKKLWNAFYGIKNQMRNFLEEETGDVNIISIILIIIVVIALIAIFKNQLIGIVNGLFDQIKTSLGL